MTTLAVVLGAVALTLAILGLALARIAARADRRARQLFTAWRLGR